MNYFMLRSIDHAGYYETRIILMLIGIGVALYFAFRKRDYRYLIMFVSGVVFQAWLEYSLRSMAMRGAGYSLSVFGVTLSPMAAIILQGCAEGGILSLMAFWYLALRTDQDSGSDQWRTYLAVCFIIVLLAGIVGWMARGLPITSPRPMLGTQSIIRVSITILIAVLLAWWKGGLRYLGIFYIGLLIYIVLTFETLHIFGARYIGILDAAGQFAPASTLPQIAVMFLSHTFEVAGGKIHYFAVPYAIGLIKFRR